MITRFLDEAEAVTALDSVSYHSCNVAGFSCSCGGALSTSGAIPFGYSGYMIDRLGLQRNFQSVKIVPTFKGVVQTSAAFTSYTAYLGVSVGLQHSATTCSEDFGDYSTGDWPGEQALQAMTTSTSTADQFYSVAGAAVSDQIAALMTTAARTSSSTAYAVLATYGIKAIPLTAAKRFVRVVVAPHLEATGCGGSNMTGGAVLIFGHPDEAPQTGLNGRVFVTSACST
ncbi:MAG: hypothetical protein NUW22_12645 [Acidobacteria bacterium]|nr:hypothetical protein [Acidobacteriota bacterium]